MLEADSSNDTNISKGRALQIARNPNDNHKVKHSSVANEPRWMSSTLVSLAKYVASRGLSSVITISLFGLFARELTGYELGNALSFTLVFGFFAASTRTLASFAARLEPKLTAKDKLSRVLIGYKAVFLAQFLLVPLFFASAFAITMNPFIALSASLILLASGFDFDLLRAAKSQEMLFPPLFLCGSIIALIYFALHSHPTQETAFLAVLIQWLPVALYSSVILQRIGLHRIRRVMVRLQLIFTNLLIVSFDGVILNLPMMPFVPTTEDIRIQVAILLRNFISALFLLPFLMYLTNRASNRDAVLPLSYHKWLFFTGIFFSSLLVFLVYIFYFRVVSGIAFEPSNVLLVAPLAFGFALYYANARYLESSAREGLPLATSMLLIAVGAGTVIVFATPNAMGIILVQAFSFICMAVIMAGIDLFSRRRKLNT